MHVNPYLGNFVVSAARCLPPQTGLSRNVSAAWWEADDLLDGCSCLNHIEKTKRQALEPSSRVTPLDRGAGGEKTLNPKRLLLGGAGGTEMNSAPSPNVPHEGDGRRIRHGNPKP